MTLRIGTAPRAARADAGAGGCAPPSTTARRNRAGGVLLLCAALYGAPVAAQLMDDIEISPAGEAVRARIQFTVPLRYLRHFPPAQGQLLNVYLQAVSAEDLLATLGQRPVDEVRRSPRSPLLPCFKVTYVPPRDARRDPLQLVIQFERSVSYTVRPGTDGRSLLIDVAATPSGSTGDDCEVPARK